MNIKVRVNGQNAIWYDKPPRVADNSIQFVKFYFDLSEDWDECTVSAQFTQGENTYTRLLVENLCSLPEELVAGKCQVSLFGYRHGDVYRATLIPLDFNVYHSGFVPSVNTPVPPTPDLYAQLLEQLYEVAILARYYIISAEQISDEYVQFSFTPSQQGMPEVPSKTIKLYRGPEGPEGSHVVGIERGETVGNITTFIIKMSDGKQFPFEVATEKGDPGYTPVKGVDYYTAEEEKAFFDRILELVNPILQQVNQAISDANDKANLANQAAADAITATQSASDAAVNANNSAQTANSAASDANKAASRADAAASGAVASTQEAVNAADLANQAADSAIGAANAAAQAASEATTAANAANDKASIADTSASAASTAASNANTAASNADKAATAANQAASLANTAANSATSAASEANTAATGANQAKTSAETAAQTANTAAAVAQEVVNSIVPDVNKLKDDLSAEQTAREQADTSLQQELSGKLPKSPSNWEQWTAEEQAAARARMGLPGEWELIEETTITEEITVFKRTTEPNGNPYNFIAVVMGANFSNIPADTEYNSSVYNVNYNNNALYDYFTSRKIDRTDSLWSYVDCSGKCPNFNSFIAKNSGASVVLERIGFINTFANDLKCRAAVINMVRASGLFPAGVKFTIWGVRA